MKNKSATTIQSIFRCRAARDVYKRKLSSIRIIQSIWRQSLSRMRVAVLKNTEAARCRESIRAEQRVMFNERRASKTIISFFRYFRMKNEKITATLSLQKWYRAYLPLLRARIMIRGFLRLQAFMRAYNVRSKNSEKVSAVLRSIRLANSRALANPVLSLGRQTDGKWNTLFNYSILAYYSLKLALI